MNDVVCQEADNIKNILVERGEFDPSAFKQAIARRSDLTAENCNILPNNLTPPFFDFAINQHILDIGSLHKSNNRALHVVEQPSLNDGL